VKKIRVRDGDKPVMLINELEFIKGWIYANVLGSDYLACISPESGLVREWIDLRRLRARFREGNADVLNGIAYDAKSGRLLVTGKNWPVLFEIKIEN
jgi:glutaminyl-peptide cyclotransferase